MKKIKSFLSIDFEYLVRGRYDTPCAVGLVRVLDGVIVEKYYTLIRPIDGQELPLAPNNGITWKMVEHAPTFNQVYPIIVSMADSLTLVSHNFTTERKVLEDSCALHGLEQVLFLDNHCDTCLMSGRKKLEECCKQYNIPLTAHNALSDAEACAHLFMILQGEEIEKEIIRTPTTKIDFSKYKEEQQNCDLAVYKPLSNDEVANKQTPFFGQVKTVVTGKFTHFPDRNLLKTELKSLGADIEHSMGKLTKILVAGSDAGPSKIKQAVTQGTYIMDEEELLKYISPQN